MSSIPATLLVCLGSYLLGGIPIANLAARLFAGRDLRSVGSQAVTTSNAGTVIGKPLMAIVGVLDIAKGAIVVWTAGALGLSSGGQAAAGVLAVAGHNWSIYLRFEGGRGLAPALGAVLALSPLQGIPVLVIALPVIALFRNVPVAFGLAAALLPLWGIALGEEPPVIWGFCAITVVVFAKRLMGNRLGYHAGDHLRSVLLYRLVFDRDVRDRRAWVTRNSPPAQRSPNGEPRPI